MTLLAVSPHITGLLPNFSQRGLCKSVIINDRCDSESLEILLYIYNSGSHCRTSEIESLEMRLKHAYPRQTPFWGSDGCCICSMRKHCVFPK